MARFQDILLEIGGYSSKYPNARLVFDVPLKSLTKNNDAIVSVSGNWKAIVMNSPFDPGPVVIATGEGRSGEEAIKDLSQKLKSLDQ